MDYSSQCKYCRWKGTDLCKYARDESKGGTCCIIFVDGKWNTADYERLSEVRKTSYDARMTTRISSIRKLKKVDKNG